MTLTYANRHRLLTDLLRAIATGFTRSDLRRRFGLTFLEYDAIELLACGATPLEIAANFEEVGPDELACLLSVLAVSLLRNGLHPQEVGALLRRTENAVDTLATGFLTGSPEISPLRRAMRPELTQFPLDEPPVVGLCPQCRCEVRLPCVLCLASRSRRRNSFTPFPHAPYSRITSYAPVSPAAGPAASPAAG